jgi:hypothetical protein
VKTPIEALGCRAENKRRDEPPGNSTDQEGERQRQAGERPSKRGAHQGTQ